MSRAARIEDHPEYPFAPGREGQIAALGAEFVDAPAAGSEEARLLGEFIVLAHEFAFLERLIQGQIRYDLPVHPRVVAGEPAETPAEKGEVLAREELEVLDWRVGASGGLADALDEIGIKVIQQSEVPSSVVSAPSELYGAFFFEGAVGPALFAGAAADRPEAAFVLAHEFAHLIADVDPYRPRFCRWDPVDFSNRSSAAEEERADRFARALLMPEPLFRETVGEMGPPPADSREADRWWETLAAFFEMPPSLVRRRLEDLGLGPLGPVPAGVAEPGPRPEPQPEARGEPESGAQSGEPPEAGVAEARPESVAGAGTAARQGRAVSLPERFVNLALAAYSSRIMETDVLARFLRTSEREAGRMLRWAGVQRQPEEEG